MMALGSATERKPVAPATIVDALRSVVPSEAIRTEGLENLAVDEVVPSVAVRPSDAEQTAAVLSACDQIGASVVPRGSGAQMALGKPPQTVDVVLEMSGLDQVVVHNPADLTLAVQAGVRLADLQAQLREEGQYLQVDAPFADQATVGGLVATNVSGPLRVLAGSWRDLVIGAEVAGPDGTVTKSGGMVVKNVSGYDVHKAHIGALGTLGVLTRINLRVAPIPTVERTLVVGFGDALVAGMAVGKLVETPVRANGVDLVARELVPDLGEDWEPWVLAVRLGGTAAGVESQLGMVVEALRPGDGGRIETLEGASQASFWRAAVAVAEAPGGGQTYAVCRFSALSSQVPSLLKSAGEIAEAAGLSAAGAAQAVNGVGRVRLTGSEDSAPYVDAVVEFRRAAEHLGAAVVVEAAPVAAKRTVDVWGFGGDAVSLELMRRLRHAFDPNRTLNPGRFLTDAA